MAMKISPIWKEGRQKDIKAFLNEKTNTFIPIITSWNRAAQWLIKEIAEASTVDKKKPCRLSCLQGFNLSLSGKSSETTLPK